MKYNCGMFSLSNLVDMIPSDSDVINFVMSYLLCPIRHNLKDSHREYEIVTVTSYLLHNPNVIT